MEVPPKVAAELAALVSGDVTGDTKAGDPVTKEGNSTVTGGHGGQR